MKKIKYIGMLLIFIISMLTGCAADMDIPSKVTKRADSVVRLKIETSFGEEYVNAVAVGKGTYAEYLVTAQNVIEGSIGTIKAVSGEQNTDAYVINTKSGVAVLELSEKLERIRPVKFLRDQIEGDENIYVLNYNSRDNAETIKEGTYISTNGYTEGTLETEVICISAEMTNEYNGAMITDKNGNFAAMGFYDGNTAVDKGITAGEVARVMEDCGIKYKKVSIVPTIIFIISILAVIALAVVSVMRIFRKRHENAPVLIGIKGGDFEGQRIPVTKENISIGRDAKFCQLVVLGDEKVSRCHCSVRYDNIKEAFILTDLSSTHGTYINGMEKLEANVPKYINRGTRFCVGSENVSFMVDKGGNE